MPTSQDYLLRRQVLAESLPECSVALIPAAREILRNGDSHYRFRQNSDFYYLTGYQEPDALLLIFAKPDGRAILFNRPRDKQAELWSGKRLGQSDALQQLAIDEAYPLSALAEQLPRLLSQLKQIVFPIGQDRAWDKRIVDAWQQSKIQARAGFEVASSFLDLTPIISELRLIKSDEEIALMREAARITVRAHQQAMLACKTAGFEYELEAILVSEFMRQGCRSVAYDSIVAAGDNACILHYTQNDQPLHPGELVLIDAGAEYASYAADVTRTFPISGQFSVEQRLIYDLVLQAQQAAMALIRPGTSWPALQETIVAVLTQGLLDLGILQGSLEELIRTQAYRQFYMHNSGHWLGLDVHDAGSYKSAGQWRKLQAGMVLTVEPGLYISNQSPGVDSRWWGIGVRIEDDVLVTPSGFENLTEALVVDSKKIEEFMRD